MRLNATGGQNPLLRVGYACGSQSLKPEELADCGVAILSHYAWTQDISAVRAYLQRAHELGHSTAAVLLP
jgi:hypothetical protein